MNDPVRRAAVNLLDVRDGLFGVSALPPELSIAIEELRTAVLRDKERRDLLGVADPLAIPSDPLFLTPQFAALTRSQWRLFGAYHLAGRIVGDMTGLMDGDRHANVAAKAVRLSDQLLKANAEFDRSHAAAVLVNGGPHVAGAVKLGEIDESA